MAVVREWPAEAVSLRDLEWLIGSWVAKRDDAEVHTTYEWMWNRSFIRMQFTNYTGKTVLDCYILNHEVGA